MKIHMLLAAIVIASWTAFAAAEPIAFEQAANVTGAGGIEIGANALIWGDISASVTDIPVFVRGGLPFFEAKVTVPFGIRDTNNFNLGTLHTRGLEDIELMVKSAFIRSPGFSMAAGVDSSFPTGDKEKGLGEGLDIDPFLAVGIEAEFLKIHANLGYRFRGEYALGKIDIVDSNYMLIAQRDLMIKPGDALHLSLGLELPVGGIVSFHADLLAALYGASAINGQNASNEGHYMSILVPGVRVHIGPFKALAGIELPIGTMQNGPDFTALYEWRFIAGVAYLFAM
jgi:hypothetical protein